MENEQPRRSSDNEPIPQNANESTPIRPRRRGTSANPEVEQQEQERDQALADALLDSIDEDAGSGAEGDKEILKAAKMLEAANSTDVVKALCQVLMLLLKRANGTRVISRVKQSTDSVIHTEDGAAIVRGDTKSRIRLPGQNYVEDGSLLPDSHPKETSEEQSARHANVAHMLETGATEASYRKQQENIIRECDATLALPATRTAQRDTVERRRQDAMYNLRALDAIKTDRINAMNSMQKSKTLETLSKLACLDGERPFENARFGLDEHLTLVLRGVSANLPEGRTDAGVGDDAYLIESNRNRVIVKHWAGLERKVTNGLSFGPTYVTPEGDSYQFMKVETLRFTRNTNGTFTVEMEKP